MYDNRVIIESIRQSFGGRMRNFRLDLTRRVLFCLVLVAPGTVLAAPLCTGINPKASTSFGDSNYWANHNCKTEIRNGFPMPDRNCTPGAVDPTVTLRMLKSAGFRTSCVRDRATTARVKAATYDAYNITHPANNRGRNQVCELDHLVSLELGGADTIDNIWPQCGPSNVELGHRYFKQKDSVENYLAAAVRAGTISLKDAQEKIAKDWTQFLGPAGAWSRQYQRRLSGGD
jgi:hypothetical protein